MTREGLEKLKKELDEIKNIKLKEVAIRIKETKDLGDLSEMPNIMKLKMSNRFCMEDLWILNKKLKMLKL